MAADGVKERRRRLPAALRREQLLDTAADLAVAEGFHDISVESVARAAGVTRAVIYQHFVDLQSLLEALVDREMARALAQVSETAMTELTTDNAVEAMVDSLTAFLQVVIGHPNTWRLVLTPPRGAPASLRRQIAAGRVEVLAGMEQALRTALPASAEPGDAELTARILSAIADEYARLALAHPRRYPPERLIRHARRLLTTVVLP